MALNIACFLPKFYKEKIGLLDSDICGLYLTIVLDI